MCGFIAAFTDFEFPQDSANQALLRMHRRGPDGEGEWRCNGVFLGHRRLAILDLDPRSTQPLHSACNRFAIVFNGEIYNYRQLRSELEKEGYGFKTESDTEVILALFSNEGERMLPRLQGMFAFVIWDKLNQKGFVARDPYGIKPVYLGTIKGGIVIASQVKALLATGLIDQAPDLVGQAGYWMLGSVPEPHTWFRDIRALSAGNCGWVVENKLQEQRCWHDISETWRHSDPLTKTLHSEHQLRERVREALKESVARHMVSDVPVGIFLSGGIDSGALAGLMREQGSINIQTITIAFSEFSGKHYDEAPAAACIAKHFDLEHHVRVVSKEEFLTDLPHIMKAMDQPSIDGINTWYASKAIAELGLKVVLSGVGGDELFLGYESFEELPRLVSRWKLLSRIPGCKRVATWLASLRAKQSGNSRWKYAPQWLQSISGAWWLRRSSLSPQSAAEIMNTGDLKFLRQFSPDAWISQFCGDLPEDLTLALAQIESTTYLRNQLLRDSDWASMDHSVELRTPLVDAHLLSRLGPLMSNFKFYPSKSLLSSAPEKGLPIEITNRRKTGFLIPTKGWIASSLHDNETWQQRVGRECYQ